MTGGMGYLNWAYCISAESQLLTHSPETVGWKPYDDLLSLHNKKLNLNVFNALSMSALCIHTFET